MYLAQWIKESHIFMPLDQGIKYIYTNRSRM